MGLHGNRDGYDNVVVVENHWAKDLVKAYQEVSDDPFCRQEVICQIVDNCASATSLIDSVARTVSSLDFNIVPSDSSPYLANLAKRVKDELISALGRIDGYDGLISAFVYDLFVKPSGFFGQYSSDGNGRPTAIGTINCRVPRPYYQNGRETFYNVERLRDGTANSVEVSRTVAEVAGIWWLDGGRSYSLPINSYKQCVDGARGSGGFLIGRSMAEKARVRIWLSATLEEYIQRVSSGTDESGLLIMNNLAWKMVLNQIKKRKEARKSNNPNPEDEGSFLYAANIGKEQGDAKWVSFRPFPEGINFLEFMQLANELVASSFNVKSWRVDAGDSANNSGKFGNAKRAIQMDSQEPTVQWVMSRFQSFINNIYLYRIPLNFQWVGGVAAMDSTRIDNQMRIAQTVNASGHLSDDEKRRLAIWLGAPRTVMDETSGISSSAEGIVRTVKKTAEDRVGLSCADLVGVVGQFGIDPEGVIFAVEDFRAAAQSACMEIVRKGLGTKTYTKPGRNLMLDLSVRVDQIAKSLSDQMNVLAGDENELGHRQSVEMLAAEVYGETKLLLDLAAMKSGVGE